MSNYVSPKFGTDKPHRKGISNRLLIIIYCSIISIITAIKLIFKLNNVEFIYLYGFFTFVILSVYLTNNDYFQTLFNSEKFRRFFIDLLVALPVICFFGGQYNSQLNYQNLEYKYTTGYNTEKNIISPTASDTLKLVGVVEDFFIFSPLNNSILIFKNKSDINNLILKDKRRK